MDDRSQRIPSLNPLLIFFIIVCWGLVIYSNSFFGEFCSDDRFIITGNPATKDITNLYHLWSSFNTRFLTGLTFALNYRLGGLEPFGYHVVNTALHLSASFLVYCFVRLTFLTPQMIHHPLREKFLPIAFFSSLIFLSHPLQTQAVAYITQRSTSLAVVFYLITLLCYIKARLETRPQFYLLAAAAMVLGMLSKEMMATVPVTFIAYELFFFRNTRKDWTARIKTLSIFFLLTLLTPFLISREQDVSAMGLKDQISSFSWDYFLTEINVLRIYIKMLFFPVGLNHHYDYPIAHGWQWPTVLSFFLLAAVLGVALRHSRKQRLLSFAVIWFFITTSTEALLVCLVHAGVLYDHWLYLPMVGFSMFVAAGLFSVFKDMSKLITLGAVLILILSGMTYQRNFVWQTCQALWEDVVKKSPEDPLPYVNLGVISSRQGDVDRAVDYFHKAIDFNRISDGFRLAQLYVNLGAAYGKKHDYDQEIFWNQKAIELDPHNALAYTNLGMASMMKKNYPEALKYGHQAVELDPGSSLVNNNLGVIYSDQGDLTRALEYFQNAVRLDPDNGMAARNIQLIQKQMEY